MRERERETGRRSTGQEDGKSSIARARESRERAFGRFGRGETEKIK